MSNEDYELYIRANKVTKITNILNDGLFYHRRTEENASLVYRERDDQIQEKLLHKQFLDEFELDFTKEELKILSITSTFTGEKKTKYKEIISKCFVLDPTPPAIIIATTILFLLCHLLLYKSFIFKLIHPLKGLCKTVWDIETF